MSQLETKLGNLCRHFTVVNIHAQKEHHLAGTAGRLRVQGHHST